MNDWLDSFNTRRIDFPTRAAKARENLKAIRDPWPWLDELLEWKRRNSTEDEAAK